MEKSNSKVDVLEQGKTTMIQEEEGYQVSLTPKKMIIGLFLTTLLMIVCNVCTSIALVKLSSKASQANMLEVNENGQLVLRGTDTVVATREAIPTLEVYSKFLPSSTTHHDSHERGLQSYGPYYEGASSVLGKGWRQVQKDFATVSKESAEDVISNGLGPKINVEVGGCIIPGDVVSGDDTHWKSESYVKDIILKTYFFGESTFHGPYGITCDDSNDCLIHCNTAGESESVQCWPRSIKLIDQVLSCAGN